MSIDVATFGCRLNAYESEIIRREAQAAGLREAIVVNTCAVTGEAVRQARQAVRRLRREKPAAKLIVTGCAAQTQTQSFTAMPEIDHVLGNAQKRDAAAWRALAQGGAGKVQVSDIMAERALAPAAIEGIEGRARAIVQVQNGCDHRCTFCIIPFGRGNSRSVPLADVVAQVRLLVERG
ncbi:MAG: tRNA (N(6)-L-threonylcarbamoyladenosine(37)-C(2))-methylthiotransferase MtaB, partial [Pseudorhodoplanes sp.]